jgi:transcriptional regulator with PAS, ATPase and Fis domain
MPFVLDETEKVDVGRHRIRVLGVDLVVVEGPSRGARASIHAPARVGSAPGNALVISDRRVSRVHCEIEVGTTTATVRDLGSTNGTFVDATRIRDADVPPGTVIRVGDSAFRIEAREGPAWIELSDRTELGDLVGSSPEMRAVYAMIERAAKTDATVLFLGETGTGKDVAARTLHALSSRSSGSFVPVDCGALPESLIESELFGHVKGAFTGAISNRKGAFEEAHGGTLFLDEIGEMPIAVQGKLLRAIESREIRRVGASTPTRLDVRIVAATNRSLARAVNEGTFREDLYYRLAVVEITMPPLRARRGDIPVLAQRFYERFTKRKDPVPPGLLADLAHRAWPGNVRELRNYIEREVTLGRTQTSGSAPPVHVPLPAGIEAIVPVHLPLKDARDAWVNAFEMVYVRTLLQKTGGNVTRAAELAGVSRRFLQRTLARLGVRAQDDADD